MHNICLILILLLAQFSLMAQPAIKNLSLPTKEKIKNAVNSLRANPSILDSKEEFKGKPFLNSLFDRSQVLREFTFRYSISPMSPKVNQADRRFEARRIDRQFGESAAGGATTSLVSKTGIPELFGAALENGALSRSNQGTVATFRLQAHGVYSLFKPDAGPCTVLNPVCDTPTGFALRGISGSVSIDNNPATNTTTSATTTEPGKSNPVTTLLSQATGGGRFSGASLRYELLSRQNIESKQSIKDFIKTYDGLADVRKNFLASWVDFLDKDEENPKIQIAWDKFNQMYSQDWLKSNVLNDPDPTSAFETHYSNALDVLWGVLDNGSDARQELWKDVLENNSIYVNKINQAFASLLLKPKLTVEYTHASPQNLSPTSNIRLLGDFKLGKIQPVDGQVNSGDYNSLLTFNAAFTFYEKVPTGLTTGRWRDAQASLQFDRKLGPATSLNRPTLSLSAYYQYQINNAILEFDKNSLAPGTLIQLVKPAAEVLNTTGHIGILQSKLTFRLTDTISIPLAISWSNRTELIKASAIRGQFGLSFDLNKLLSKSE